MGSSVGGPLGVSLDTEGRTNVEFYVWSAGAATYVLWGSNDEYAWRELDDELMVSESGGRNHIGLNNAYRWVHLGVNNLFDNFIEIVAS